MNRIGATVGDTRTGLLALLRRSTRSVNELAQAMGISDNAVRMHLAAMQRDGLVQTAGIERLTGGKPAQLFELTGQAEELYPKAYAPVLGGLLELLEERVGRQELLELLRVLGARAGAGAGRDAGGAEARVQEAAAVLRELGGDVDVTPSTDGWRIQGFGCPLSALTGDHSELCAMVEALVAEITQRPVRECCDRGGRPRCAFEVD
jgi:predicted ArsR family transcriptional regulator